MKGIVNGPHGVNANEAFSSAYLRVKILTTGKAAVAGLGENTDGVYDAAVASGADGNFVPLTPGGILKFVLSGTCSAGDRLYGAASGKVSTTASGKCLGIALEAGTDGCVIPAHIEAAESRDAIRMGSYTAVAQDGTNGYVDIECGFGAVPAAFFAMAYNGSTGAPRVVATITTVSTTKKRVTVTSLATNDIVVWMAARSSNTVT